MQKYVKKHPDASRISPGAVGFFRLVLAAAAIPPDALQVVIAQSLRARGDILIPTLTHFISYVLVMAPLAWFLALPAGRGVNGIVEGVLLASILSAGLLLVRFAVLSRRPAG